ncbi:MAG: hypothetical protein SF052_06065 [Bacteroidia bacterium]|nr:hypothetical protein [Bacteroidia bacterium]
MSGLFFLIRIIPLLIVFLWTFTEMSGQCPKITFIYADACEAPDGKGEFLVLETSDEVLPVVDLSLQLPGGLTICDGCSNSWFTADVSNLNSLAGCGTLFIGVGPGDIIPANAITVIFTNRNFKDDVDWSNFCGTGPIYVLTINKVNNNNKYPHNDGSCAGTTYVSAEYSGLSDCSSYTVSYEPCSMALENPAGSGGGPALIFDENGAVIYTDVGCDNFIFDATTLPIQQVAGKNTPPSVSNYVFLNGDQHLVILRKFFSTESISLKILDIKGQTLLKTQAHVHNGMASIPLDSIPPGIFITLISDKYGIFTIHKFVKLPE